MSSSHDPITPTQFDAADPTPAGPEPSQPAAKDSTRPSWVLPGLAGLAVLAALVVFVLPSLVAPGDPAATEPAPIQADAGDRPAARPATPAEDAAGPEEASPWQDAQAAKLRKEAQDVLQALLEIQFDLEERGVNQWGEEAFAAATALAQQGDEQYKARDFVSARESYEQGLAAMEALQAALPGAVDAELARATQALEEVEPETLASALDLLDVMEPENPGLPALRQRQQQLPALAAALESAASAEAANDLAAAEQALVTATGIDPAHQRSAAELARISAAYLEQRFNAAMSEGYAALDAGQLSDARRSFQAAAKLRPGSSEARAALTEVDAASTASRLASLQRSGERQEQAEDWTAAVSSYQQALKLDANVLYAVEGMQRAQPRAALDAALQQVLEKPERLSEIGVAQDTAQLLARAQAVSPRGPALSQQISTLERLLEKANTPIRVTLRSDEETEVIVLKVARLGLFEQKSLNLRPGTYTALGTRNGYYDVRVSFDVSHDSAPPNVQIACTEPI
ncbi:MAG: hypothetical protein AAGI11_06100 [Pseudomonadota bacterium]